MDNRSIGEVARDAFLAGLQIDPATRARLKSERYASAWQRAGEAAARREAEELVTARYQGLEDW
jgi:hypothetical protein